MRISLAVTTYERPDALAAVLETVQRQSTFPQELIVADDGSSEPTRTVVDRFTDRAPFTVRLVKQEHQGFRVARLRNLAIARAQGDYLIFVDGDMMLHPEFIADHVRHARPGYFTQGVRIPADSAGRRRVHAWRNVTLSRLTRQIGNALLSIKSCNLGVWRSDLLKVNGFDENFVGWGPEDKELCVRLRHAGVKRQSLLFGGIAYHLAHPPADRARRAENERLFAVSRAERRVRCSHGVDAHML